MTRYVFSIYGKPCRRCWRDPVRYRNWYCARCYARAKKRAGRVDRNYEQVRIT